MRALRRSIKGDKGENRPQHISITPKSEYAVTAPMKLIQAKVAWSPNDEQEWHTLSQEQINKYLSFNKDDYLSVVGQPNDKYYEAWTTDKVGNHVQGLVPIDKFQDVPKQRRSAGSSTLGTPALPDSGYSTARSYGRSDSAITPKTPKHIRMSSMTRGAMVYGVVQYDFNAERPDELDAKAGEAIIVIAQSNPEWFVAKPIGRLGGPGLIPVSFIEIKDMATGLPVPDPHKAVQAAGVPKVEEWKKLAAEYKNSSISLGQLTVPGAGGIPNNLAQGMDKMSLGDEQHPPVDQRGYSPAQQQGSLLQQRLLAPISASIPRYCFENDKYWYIIECVMEDGSHWELSRFYQNFYDFQISLLQQFPAEAATDGGTRILPFMPGPVTYVTDAISNGRRESLDDYVKRLLALPQYISRCQLVRELFAPREGDFELDPKAMQEDYRLSSASHHSNSMYHSQNLSRESSSQQLDNGYYSSQSRSNPWQSQDYGGYPSYSANSSQSNQNLHASYGNQNGSNSALNVSGSAEQIKIKVWVEDDLVAIKVSSDVSFDELESVLKKRLLKSGLIRSQDAPIVIQYKDIDSGGTQALTDYSDLSYALSQANRAGTNLQIYVGTA